MRQGVDRHRRARIVDCLGAGERVGTIDIHRARTADALPARAAEGECWINVVLDPDERVENHRPAIITVDVIRVETWIFAVVRIPPVNTEFGDVSGVRRTWPFPAFRDLGVSG